jgi:hypothetical protein
VKKMAETVKGTVVIRSIPGKDVEMKVVLYLASIYRDVPPDDISDLVARTKPLTVVRDVNSMRGHALVDAINGLGASAYFLRNMGKATRH